MNLIGLRRLCWVFLILNFLVFLPLGSFSGIIVAWTITGVPAVLHCWLRGASTAAQQPSGRKALLISGRLLYAILAVNAFTVIMHLIEPDAFILIAIALPGGGAGLLHIVTTTLLIRAGRPWTSRF